MRLHKSLVLISIAAILGACGGSSDSNQAPIFANSSYSFILDEDTDFTGSVLATDADPLTYTVSSAANNGTFILNADGSFSYSPNANFFGEDTVQVQASDGILNSRALITFAVSNINDEPELVGSRITVSTSADTSGQIEVNDADGDAITFALVTQPSNGTITLDASTGAFTYSTASLSQIQGSFTITYTDNNIATPIEVSLSLAPAYTTNADKLNFYYASANSHLKQAEALKETIADDNFVNIINAELGLAYSIAGFDRQALDLFDEITTLDDQADAYDEAAEVQQALGNIALASEFRSKSELLYTQFVAEKGVSNMSRSDFGVFLNMVRDYLAAGELDGANSLLTNLQVFASAFIEPEYNSSFGSALTSFRTYAQDASENYFAERSDENKQRAIQAITTLGQLVKQIGFWTERRTDLPSERQRVLRATWVAELFFNISANEQAKDYTNFALSLYGLTGLDDNYIYAASPYAESTLASYTFSLSSLAGLVGALYPDAPSNPALDLLTSPFDIEDAQVSLLSKQIANNINAGVDVETAIAPAFTLFLADDKYLELYEVMVENFVAEPAAARLLNTLGNTEKAIDVLNRAIDLLISEEYVDGVLASRFGRISNITGRKGCARAVDLMLSFGGDASAIASKCASMVDSYLTTAAGKVSTSSAIEAYRNVLRIQNTLGDIAAVKVIAPKLLAEINLITDPEDKADELFLAANYLLKYGAIEEAQPILFSAFDALKIAVEADESGEVLADAIEMIEERVFRMRVYDDGMSKTGFSEQESFLRGLRIQAGKFDNYATYYQSTTARVSTEAAYYTSALIARSINEQLANIEELLVINSAIENESAVASVLSNDNLSEADILVLTALYTQVIAARDDFEGTQFASIDTDNDGLPNFFVSRATEAEISASGLTADDDADNDGIADEDDINPLN